MPIALDWPKEPDQGILKPPSIEARTVTTKEALHRLIDELPEEEAGRVLRALQTSDPVLRAIELAPEDDEPLTDEERASISAARAAVARGEVISHDALLRELGW